MDYDGVVILNRRQFFGAMPAAMPMAAAAQSTNRTKYYVLERFFLENGSQPGRLAEFFSKSLIPAMKKVHNGPVIVMEALAAPHMPQVVLITGVETLEQTRLVSEAVAAGKEVKAAFDRWESGEPAYLSEESMLLEATDYSPEIQVTARPEGAPRIFELRTYHSPTARQWKLLHERFAGPEIKIFHRLGIHPLFYSSTVFGPNQPNLTYLIPFESLAAREKAWTAFGADPEWIKVRAESIAKGGQISAVSDISLYRAAAYSPIR
ncbi:MAG: hypothetical protein C0504_18905 [Candidatus Solibacter sp.]|nr:hypothetical protein [Candidatus Solibacter sp.]